ncbi:MAG: GspE/PulE family protein, partial [Prochlorotrichaceae cyanobacterium]
AKIVIQAALTGHLVFSTLHANDALGTIPRLRDIGREAGLISDALLGVVAQRLLRKNCPYCSQPYVPTPEELALFQLEKSSDTELQWRKGVGCDHCFQSGYLGREAVIELLDVDDAIRSFIYQGDLVKMSAYLREQNFQSFAMAAAEKVSKGITTSEEVLRGVGRRFLMRSY